MVEVYRFRTPCLTELESPVVILKLTVNFRQTLIAFVLILVVILDVERLFGGDGYSAFVKLANALEKSIDHSNFVAHPLSHSHFADYDVAIPVVI